MRRLVLPLLVLFTSARPASAQDTLITAGYRWLDTFEQSNNLEHARNAHRAFSALLRKQEGDPNAHLGLGLTYAAAEGYSLDALGFNDASRITNNTLAVRHLLAAVRGGADAVRAARALHDVAFREYSKERILEIATQLASSANLSDDARAMTAELYLALDMPDRARAVLGTATSLGAERARAITELFDPATRQRGGDRYLRALEKADSTTTDPFIRDARWLADPEEAATWMRLSSADRIRRLVEFWQRRALVSAVSPAERLATHFVRVRRAREDFNFYRQRTARFSADSARTSITAAPVIGSTGAISLGIHGRLYHVDDRAFVYVRYGEPDERIETPGIDMSNQSWVYRRIAERPVSFDFFLPIDAGRMRLDARGWTLIYDVMSCGTAGVLPYFEQYVRDRQSVDPRYGLILQHCTLGRGKKIVAADADAVALPFRKEREIFLATAVGRDNAVPLTRKNIRLLTDVVQYRGAHEATDITAVIAWPLQELTAARDGLYRMRVTFFVADTIANRIVSTDTTLTVRMPASGTATVRVHMTLAARPAHQALYRITLKDLNDSSVNTVVGDTIEVRTIDRRDLAISDIAVASEGGAGSWRRAGRTLSLLPRGVAPQRFQIYYEIYNIAPRTSYNTRITLIPQGDELQKLIQKLKGQRQVSFEFGGANENDGTTVSELRGIGTELPAGNYLLRVEVDAGGRRVLTERPVRIPPAASR